jgi:hypothetical protein
VSRELLAGEGSQQPAGHGRGDHGVSGRHCADRGEQLVGLGVFEQEAAGACAQPAVRVFVEVERCHDDHAGAVAGGEDSPGGFDAVGTRHPDVHQDDVGVERCGLPFP